MHGPEMSVFPVRFTLYLYPQCKRYRREQSRLTVTWAYCSIGVVYKPQTLRSEISAKASDGYSIMYTK